MRLTRVTFCAYDDKGSIGGPQTWLLRLLPPLRDQGFQIRILCLTWGPEGGHMLRELKRQGFECVTRECNSDTTERIQWILTELSNWTPDVFVPNLVTPAWFASRWVMQAGIPCVGVFHSDDVFYRGLQQVFLAGRPEHRLTHAVGVSSLIEEQLKSSVGKQTQVHRIPYGVPVPEERVSRSEAGLRLAYVGRFADEQKQISLVARALCRVVRELPGTMAVLYGDGPDRGNVEETLAREGSGLAVRMGGNIPSHQVQEKLMECDVLVLLSDYEGLPIALLEAMACGCVPVCLKMRSGIPELVVDGQTGLLVDDRGDGFVQAIRHLATHPQQWHAMSAAARRKIKEGFSLDICNKHWADLLAGAAFTKVLHGAIPVPARLNLPPVHPDLACEDCRHEEPSLPQRWLRQCRMAAGRLRRQILPGKPSKPQS